MHMRMGLCGPGPGGRVRARAHPGPHPQCGHSGRAEHSQTWEFKARNKQRGFASARGPLSPGAGLRHQPVPVHVHAIATAMAMAIDIACAYMYMHTH